MVEDFHKKRNDPGYQSWLAVGDALVLGLGPGLRQYAKEKMKELHDILRKTLGSGVQCTCVVPPWPKPNPHADKLATCPWADNLKRCVSKKRRNKIPWSQSDSSKWHDPTDGYWEIAKLFMSDLGDNMSSVRDPDTTDVASLLSLLISCNYFTIQDALLKAVRKSSRNKCAHAPTRSLSASEKTKAFQDMYDLLKDPELSKSKVDVQCCLDNIKSFENGDISILQKKDFLVLEEFRHIQERDLKHQEVKQKQKELRKEQKARRKHDKMMISSPTMVNKLVHGFFHGVLFILSLVHLIKIKRKNAQALMWSLVALFLFLQVGDESSNILPDEGKLFLKLQ